MKLIVFLTVTAGGFAAGSCDNPLFATANWPSGVARPRYLTTPQDVTNTTFCSKFQSGSTQTCCDKTTMLDIVSVFQSYRDKMAVKGNSLQGSVRDTFNDFDPDNQKASGARALIDDGYEGRELETKAPPKDIPKPVTVPPRNETSDKNTTGSAPHDSDGKQPRFLGNTTVTGGQNSPPANSSLGPPPMSSNPPGFNTVTVPDSNLTTASQPEGRGKQRKRPGLLKMSVAGQQAIKNITRSMNALMMQFAHTMGKCMVAQLKHLAGMLCMGCDPDWASWVSNTTTAITVDLANDACTELSDNCTDFVLQAQNLPTLISQYKASIQAVIDSEVAAGNIKASDVPTDDLGGLTKAPAAVTPVCTTTDTCKTYICNLMSKGQTGVAPDPTTVADPASVSTATSSVRQLTATVTYQYSDTGYNSVSLGDTASSSSTTTSTAGALIDGVSTTTAPLDTSTSAATIMVVLAAGYLLAL